MKMFSFKNTTKSIYVIAVLKLLTAFIIFNPLHAIDEPPRTKNEMLFGVVNFKTCVDLSKLGKQEHTTFEAMKKQMETTLEEKEKALTLVASKFENPDFLDSLSPEAEAKMRKDFRDQTQEFSQLQNQFYQALQQANYQILQKIAEVIGKAAEEVAKERNLDVIVNEDNFFYYTPSLDVSIQVVAKMDSIFEKEAKAQK